MMQLGSASQNDGSNNAFGRSVSKKQTEEKERKANRRAQMEVRPDFKEEDDQIAQTK